MKQRLLPHYGERTIPVEMAVIHCSAFPLEKCVEIWDEYKVSPHYAIDENGEIIQLVDENQKAYHAGKGFWRGRRGDMNEGSIGVELVNMSLGQEPGSYPSAQIAALTILLQKLIKKYGISAQNIVGHSDIPHLLNNVYPSGDESLLQGERFISSLQNISQACRRLKSRSEQKYADVIQRAR